MLNAVTDFGAKPVNAINGRADNWLALQNAINAAQASPTQELFIPAGQYFVYKPLRATSTLRIRGEGKNNTGIYPGFNRGPVLTVAPSIAQGNPAPPLVAGLTASGGNAISFDNSNAYWFDLRMDGGVEIDGLSQFTVEAYIKPSAAPGGPNMIASSMGRLASGSPVSVGLSLYTNGDGVSTLFLGGSLNIGGTLRSISGGTMTVGTVYHVALTYDGSTLRLFLGTPGATSVMVASVAASGTVRQAGYEDMLLGPSIQDWPSSTLLNASFVGTIDSFAISSIARYTASFVIPNAKFGTDANHLIVLNWWNSFDNWNLDIFTISTDHGYLPIRRNNLVFVASVQGFEPVDIAFGGGLLMMYCQNFRLSSVGFAGSGPYSAYLWNNCFEGAVNDMEIYGGSRCGFIGAIAAGVINFNNPRIIGGRYQFVMSNGSGVLTNPYFAPSSSTEIPLILKAASGQSAFNLINPAIDAESAGPACTASVLLSGLHNFTSLGGVLEGATSLPPVQVDGGQGMTIIGTEIKSPGTPAEMIHFINQPASPVALINASKTPSSAPWSLSSGAVRIL